MIVEIKGTGQKVQFPDGMSQEEMLQALRRQWPSTSYTNALNTTTQGFAEPVEQTLEDKIKQSVADFLFNQGIISDRYGAQRIGENIAMGAGALPVIGDLLGGDELGRALRDGDAAGIGLGALAAVPVVGDAAKGGIKMRLFHGTNADFDKFDISKIGSSSDPGIRGRGFYFTPNKKTAESYGDMIKEVDVSLDNPLDLQSFSSAKEVADYLDIPEDIVRFRVDKLPSGEFKSVSVSPNYTGTFTSAIKQKGHDSVIHGQEVVVFDPEKINTVNTYSK